MALFDTEVPPYICTHSVALTRAVAERESLRTQLETLQASVRALALTGPATVPCSPPPADPALGRCLDQVSLLLSGFGPDVGVDYDMGWREGLRRAAAIIIGERASL